MRHRVYSGFSCQGIVCDTRPLPLWPAPTTRQNPTSHGSRDAVARGVSVLRRCLPAAAGAAALAVAAAAGALFTRPGLVDRQRPALELGAVQGGDGFLGA